MVQGQDVAVVEEFVYLGAPIHALTVSSPDRMYTYHSRNLTLTEVLDMAKTAHTGGCCQRSVLPSGLLCRWPNGLELTARQAPRPIAID